MDDAEATRRDEDEVVDAEVVDAEVADVDAGAEKKPKRSLSDILAIATLIGVGVVILLCGLIAYSLISHRLGEPDVPTAAEIAAAVKVEAVNVPTTEAIAAEVVKQMSAITSGQSPSVEAVNVPTAEAIAAEVVKQMSAITLGQSPSQADIDKALRDLGL